MLYVLFKLSFVNNDQCCIVERELPASLLEHVRVSTAEINEVADDDLLEAVMAIEQTQCDNELSDDALLLAVAEAEKIS